MEEDSGEENQKIGNVEDNDGSGGKILSSNDGQSKPKRQMKTPFQLETLEKAYALETYPTEAMRADLSEKLGLSDRQLQMWFCHRRLKDKKDLPPKKPRKTAVPLPDSPTDEPRLGPELGNGYASGSGSGSSPFARSELRNVVPRGMPGYYESAQSMLELRAVACVEAQLGEPLREDGPILGIDFDPLPPDAFGAPIGVTEQRKGPNLAYDSKLYERHDARPNKVVGRAYHEYPFLQNHSGIRSDAYGQLGQPHLHNPMMDGPTRTPSFVRGNEQLPRIHAAQAHASRVRLSSQDKQGMSYPSPPRDDDGASQGDFFTNLPEIGMGSHFNGHPIARPGNPSASSTEQIFHNDGVLRMERKRKSTDARISKEVDDIKIRKELERQDNLRRKSEERMRKEMERQDRERKKEEERLMRERQREEERTKREQKRELERREKNLLKEHLRAEKRRQKEEVRKEKEAERRKAAMEKAIARKIAKESMELIEDEQLELMELAATSKGVSSIAHLGLDTLQNLESFIDSLIIFPPESVKLKKPFAIQPWMNSDENVGNLLMVWRFFITFADVLELWPFTLDEFVQAFHDYDSRLLCELHVALLKVIIKDIEDVARTSSTGLGAAQNGAANPGGGHPGVVEGAYAWGFDIRNWQKHLNQLTWPEIFRQLALSAGFGPQLKKRCVSWSYANDKDEAKNCENIISILRNGSAAENAVAKMQERGLLGPRRSRHRCTPGTVKFAAFHVLSLEGSKGLTVLELAEKIQKSGLRDLTTSKTPEASISVALTRDTKLFERIAPSTYRVRAAYRKDPADAEAILSDARKKIQIFANGSVAGEDADDVEREEESESDEIDEDPEIEDLVNLTSVNKTLEQYDTMSNCSANGKENLGHDIELVQSRFDKDIPCFPENGSIDADCPSTVTGQPVAGEDLNAGNLDEDNMEIDESKFGESWVQGLTEGEYSDLSVEERLNALVALVGVANEGNSIRVVLEDRLEAANAMKKQMWAEAQIDKIRLKDDNVNKLDFPSLTGNKVETQGTSPAAEGIQSPLLDINNNINEASPRTGENQRVVPESTPIEKPSLGLDLYTGPDNAQTQQSTHTSKRSRSQLKSYIAHIAEEMYVYRSLPLGQDRRRNRYWQFVASASSSDPGAGRIFVELHDGNWRLIDSEEAFDALLTLLDSRGIRESHLRLMLYKMEKSFKENIRKSVQCAGSASRGETSIKNIVDETDSSPDHHAESDSRSSALCGLKTDTLETSSSFKIELGKSKAEKKAALGRYQDFQKWMWKEFHNPTTLCATKYGKKRCKPLVNICDICLNSYFSEDSHCNSCHWTFSSNNGFNFSQHAFQCGEKKLDSKDIRTSDSSLPFRTRLLKALLAFIEIAIPSEAFRSIWTEESRKRWGMKLSTSSSVKELLQMLTLFERSLQRNFLSSNFPTTEELLGLSRMPESSAHAFTDPESVPLLPWVPQTTAAMCLRLFEFDASISYIRQEKPEPCDKKEVSASIKLPSRYAPFKPDRVFDQAVDQDELINQNKSAYKKIARSSNKRGRGSYEQGRSKKLSRRTYDSKQDTGGHKAKGNDNPSQRLNQQGRGTGMKGQAGGRGRRTVRKPRVEKRAVEDLLGRRAAPRSSKNGKESLRKLHEEWDNEKVSTSYVEGVDNSNSAEEVDSEDNGPAVEYEQGNWEVGFNDNPSRWVRDEVHVVSDEDVDAYEDDNVVEEAEEEDSEADVISEGSDGIMANRVVNEESSDSPISEDSSD